MPFTEVTAKMAELTEEVHQFNDEVHGLRREVNQLRRMGRFAFVVGATIIVALAAMIVAGLLVVRDNRNTIEVNDYNACRRGNSVRAAVVDGFETTLNTVIGPAPGPEAPEHEVERYQRYLAIRDQILADIESDALQQRDCGDNPR